MKSIHPCRKRTGYHPGFRRSALRNRHLAAAFSCCGQLLLILTVLWSGLSWAHIGRPAKVQQTRNTIDHMVVVKFKPEGLKKSSTPTGSSRTAWSAIDRLEPVLPASSRLRKSAGSTGLDRVYYAHYRDDRTPEQMAQLLQLDDRIEYAEPKYVQQICSMPNDSLISQQLAYLNRLKLPEAWSLAKGEMGNVVIALVDAGTNIRHPDVAGNLWHNPGEVAGNGLDDDANGHIDDIYGWNFANNSADPTGLSNTPTNAEHGTITASICAAVTDNAIGLAGTSWNAKLMAINCSSPYSDNAITSGYDGILYATGQGADIINCSWGSLGSASLYEQDVVDYALQQGSLIVAAAGNDNDSTLHYPSSYNGVLSVAALNSANSRASFSNFGRAIDVSAPGLNVYGAYGENGYKMMSGTSVSSPLVAGIIALVKTAHPDWTSLQAAEQVRITCTNIDALNPAFAGKLGRGVVNAYAALTTLTPSIRLSQVRTVDANQDGIIKPGEAVQINLSLINYLADANDIQIELTEDSPYAALSSTTASLSHLSTSEIKELTTPFVLQVAGDTPRGHQINFTLAIKSGNYSDTDHFDLTVLPTFGNIEINHLTTSVTNIGRIGFGNTDASKAGIGFKYQKGPNLLFEGAIICGTGPNRLANAARGVIPPDKTTVGFDEDFTVAEDGDLQFYTPGLRADQESVGVFEDRNADQPMQLRITQKTFAGSSASLQDFILFQFTIRNQSTETLAPFHFGILFDWDIDGGHYGTNMVKYDASHRLGYAYDTGAGPATHVGMAILNEVGVSSRGIFNDEKNPANTTWGLYDGFSDAEKWESISGGASHSEAGPADISQVIGAGPLTLQPQEQMVLYFALVAGNSLQELQNAVDQAQTYRLAVSAQGKHFLPSQWELSANYPNPFNAATVLSYQIAQTANVKLEIYDLLGRRVKTLTNRLHNAGAYQVIWNGEDEAGHPLASGAYFYHLESESFRQTRKMILLR